MLVNKVKCCKERLLLRRYLVFFLTHSLSLDSLSNEISKYVIKSFGSTYLGFLQTRDRLMSDTLK